ncbi:hypothetical protein AA14362_2487 [Acetobacter cerevisiae DSM 14362]|nr:hypothetical protein AA14362_2487 [Acetobacter cerevisiae DSM 14362]
MKKAERRSARGGVSGCTEMVLHNHMPVCGRGWRRHVEEWGWCAIYYFVYDYTDQIGSDKKLVWKND